MTYSRKLARRARAAVGGAFLIGLVQFLAPAGAASSDWSVVPSPDPGPSATIASLAGVSCPSSTECFAVGQEQEAGFIGTLAETWNGQSWSFVQSANPPGSNQSELSGVACPSTTFCVAVGNSVTSSPTSEVPLVETWNGTSWSVARVPAPGAFTFNDLLGVSCSAVTNCVAVGYSDNSTGSAQYFGASPLIETWDGSTWSLAQAADSRGQFYAVACPNSTICVAVGDNAAGQTMSETWNGQSWSAADAFTANGYLSGVSCPSSSSCMAVGTSQPSNNVQRSLVATWDGSTWSETSPASPASSTSSLTAVSCASPSYCAAIGNNDGYPVVTWDGNSWTDTQIINSPSVNGVSCQTWAPCFAVGDMFENNRWVPAVAASPAGTQTITFTSTPPSRAQYGATYTVAATGGASGNPVTFSIDASSAAGTCSVTGSTVTFTGVGTCIIDASQAGNEHYWPADTATQQLTVTAAPTTLNAQQAQVTLRAGSKQVTMSAILTSNVTRAGIAGQTVAFTLGPNQDCSATTNDQGNATCSVEYGGTQVVTSQPNQFTASFAGTDDYLATSTTGTVSAIPGVGAVPDAP